MQWEWATTIMLRSVQFLNAFVPAAVDLVASVENNNLSIYRISTIKGTSHVAE